MKKLIISVAAILIATFGAFAQKAGTNQNLSQKELMKMKVMKINPLQTYINSYSVTVVSQNLSQKEMMKTKVVKIAPVSIRVEFTNNSRMCTSCLALSKLSSKEVMKAKVVGIYTCPMYSDISIATSGRCPKCGMSLTERNNHS